jgi:hypothetical protein
MEWGDRMATEATWATVLDYEERLRRDHDWSMDEGDRFFQRDDAVYKTLRKVAHRLDELGIAYAVAGGLALNAHGYRRLTVDIDLLVTREGLKAIHVHLERLGCVSPSADSKKLRDTEHGVRIDFLVTGGYPGDGKPKPVAFPDPAVVAVERNGINYLSLPCLIELKLASGITNRGRLKDLADVVELLKRQDLPQEFAEQLDPFVRVKFTEFWEAVQQGEREP